jgi:glycosyltransferase involved in cell wall biosynthesis
LEAGGLERFVTRMALRAAAGGEFVPVVCCLNRPSGPFLAPLREAGVEVYGAPRGWARRSQPLVACSRLIRKIKPDLVHSQVNFALLQQFLAVRGAGCRRFCVTERSCYRRRGLARLRRFAQFHLIRAWGARYSTNAEAVAAHLARMVCVPVAALPVLPNGVADIPPDRVVRERVRARLGWLPETIGIGYVARMSGEKGHIEFLEALRLARGQGLPVEACLVGDGPERGGLERLVEELDLSTEVSFTGTIAEVEDYLQAFDVVALFSAREGMPNAVLEAMAAGKAVVATRVGAIPQLLDEGRAGVVVENTDVTELGAALADLVRDGARRERLGRAARERVETLFGLERTYARLLGYYHEVMA